MDPDQIGLAVTEVVLNAIQAEPKGSVSVRVHRDAAERRLVIAVEDDGAGMSEHTLSHAFDPFFSARPAGRRSGLGLARARRLVELHGGTIRIRSEAGVGTEVWIALPTDGACVDATERSAA
jgi:signal transduction histidine kinase